MAPNGSVDGALGFDTFHNIIDGKISDTVETRHTVNPSTLEKNPETPVSTLEDVNRAVEVAKRAAKPWAKVPWADRKKAVEAFAAAIEAHSDEFARLVVKEQGKTFPKAQGEVFIGVQQIRDFIELGAIPEEVCEKSEGHKIYTRYAPIGVVGAIIPWNFPVAVACGKIAPALLTGNALILKPSPVTPYCGLKLAELAQRFFPPGVFQCLSGNDELGPWLTEHPGIGKITFMGPIAAGKKVMESCSRTLKRVVLELGGNDAAVLCPDFDPASLPLIAGLCFENAGQICVAIKRLYVHEDVYDSVLASIVEIVKNLKVGDGFEEGVTTPPIGNRAHFERIKDLLADIEKSQLKIAVGSTKPFEGAGETTGFFVAPTVVDNPPDDSRIVAEEQFAPIIPILKWKDEEDVIRRVNDTPFGLGASVWTRDLEKGERISNQFESGNVWVNTHAEIGAKNPWGGVKESGLGIQSGVEGLKTYCDLQTVTVRKNGVDLLRRLTK
ncbi:aldehyde dehydrogenase [Hypoxylon sp. FL0543]|nr:aldehyde dehydrogenase [Hypoxylon sp. FL0543]